MTFPQSSKNRVSQADAHGWTEPREQGAAELLLQQTILANVNFSVVATDPCGAILWINAAAERWLGLSVDELKGRATPAIFLDREELGRRAAELTAELGHPVEPGFEALIGRFKRGIIEGEREWTYLHKDGTRLPVAVSVAALRTTAGDVTGYLLIGRDIAQRKAAERRQTELMEQLQDAYKIKTAFLANVSHEIRTPMNGILGMTELLQRTDLPPIQRYYVENIRECGESLLLIVNDVLDMAKLESGKLTFERTAFDLLETVGKTVEFVSPAAEKKGIPVVLSFSPEVPGLVLGDPGRLRQILTNLVGNAIKFTDTGAVTVYVGSAKCSSNPHLLRFEVKDTGIGISPEAKAKLFQPFVQAAPSITRRFGGTGLGLSIARQLVLLMGGEMGVESVLGEGSLFWFTLPLAETAATTQGAQARKLHILVADDNPLNQRVALGMLNTLSHTADVVSTGSKALQAAKTTAYDLILMDCQMPDMDGYSACRAIREAAAEHPALAKIPIVALTGYINEETRAQCLMAGMDGYLSKPLRIAELHATLDQYAPKEFIEPSGGNDSSQLAGYADLAIMDSSKLNELRTIEISGQPNIFQKLLELFFREGEPLFGSLLEAIDAGDGEAVLTRAHKLAGSCCNFGGLRITRICRDLEDRGRIGDISGIKELRAALEEEFKKFCHLLQREFDSIKNA